METKKCTANVTKALFKFNNIESNDTQFTIVLFNGPRFRIKNIVHINLL